MMADLILIMQKIGEKQQVPVSLQIDNEIYLYEETPLFEKLTKFVNQQLTVVYLDHYGVKCESCVYDIKCIIPTAVPPEILLDNKRDIERF